MALEARLDELKLKHKQMETEIVSKNKYPSVDQSAVAGLKRVKMKIKDEISSIEAKLAS